LDGLKLFQYNFEILEWSVDIDAFGVFNLLKVFTDSQPGQAGRRVAVIPPYRGIED